MIIMFDFNWRTAYQEWEPDAHSDERERAFAAGWLAALAQIIAMLEDERKQAETSL
jgi:hypothetical protein